jgi:hypothetical protein
MENESLVSIVGAPDAPYATNLAHRCGLAVDYFAITPRPCPTTSLPPAGRPRA